MRSKKTPRRRKKLPEVAAAFVLTTEAPIVDLRDILSEVAASDYVPVDFSEVSFAAKAKGCTALGNEIEVIITTNLFQRLATIFEQRPSLSDGESCYHSIACFSPDEPKDGDFLGSDCHWSALHITVTKEHIRVLMLDTTNNIHAIAQIFSAIQEAEEGFLPEFYYLGGCGWQKDHRHCAIFVLENLYLIADFINLGQPVFDELATVLAKGSPSIHQLAEGTFSPQMGYQVCMRGQIESKIPMSSISIDRCHKVLAKVHIINPCALPISFAELLSTFQSFRKFRESRNADTLALEMATRKAQAVNGTIADRCASYKTVMEQALIGGEIMTRQYPRAPLACYWTAERGCFGLAAITNAGSVKALLAERISEIAKELEPSQYAELEKQSIEALRSTTFLHKGSLLFFCCGLRYYVDLAAFSSTMDDIKKMYQASRFKKISS